LHVKYQAESVGLIPQLFNSGWAYALNGVMVCLLSFRERGNEEKEKNDTQMLIKSEAEDGVEEWKCCTAGVI